MKVKLIKNYKLGGRIKKKGTVLDLWPSFAKELIKKKIAVYDSIIDKIDNLIKTKE